VSRTEKKGEENEMSQTDATAFAWANERRRNQGVGIVLRWDLTTTAERKPWKVITARWCETWVEARVGKQRGHTSLVGPSLRGSGFEELRPSESTEQDRGEREGCAMGIIGMLRGWRKRAVTSMSDVMWANEAQRGG
jgi:hypothetical protein